LVAAVSYVPDVTRQEVAVGARHCCRLDACFELENTSLSLSSRPHYANSVGESIDYAGPTRRPLSRIRTAETNARRVKPAYDLWRVSNR
jgi:hypothetical protein